MTLDTVYSRMEAIGFDPYPIDVDDDVRWGTVSRLFLSQKYGGNPQETFPAIRKALLDQHGLNDWMFPSKLYNPHAPEVPGAPGLFFECYDGRGESRWPGTHRVIVRLEQSQWLYVGHYELSDAEPLTRMEWLSQGDKVSSNCHMSHFPLHHNDLPQVKTTWAKNISIKGWGKAVRARIALKKQLLRPPTEAELAEALSGDNEYRNVTIDEITRAYNRGYEVRTLSCRSSIFAFTEII
jgi:hypothetical protein